MKSSAKYFSSVSSSKHSCRESTFLSMKIFFPSVSRVYPLTLKSNMAMSGEKKSKILSMIESGEMLPQVDRAMSTLKVEMPTES